MLEIISNFYRFFWGQLSLLMDNVGPADIFDVLIVAFLTYELIILVRNTRAAQLAKGIFILIMAYAVAAMFQLRTVKFLLAAVMQFGIVVLAVIFQPELRRAIEQVGGVNSALARLFRPHKMDDTVRTEWEKALVAICDAAERMAEDRTGALMVLERHTNLNEVIRTGTPMHSDVNIEILDTVFYEGTALHDGAIIIRDARIEAAGCFLPLSNNLEIGKEMGTRHRAALGVSENSDAVVVVVSEETGIISLAKNGVLIRRLDRQNLFNLLISEITPRKKEEEETSWFKRRKARATKNEKEQ